MPSLTVHLTGLEPIRFLEATQHPFLASAATSRLSSAHLKQWLAQDRLYAMSYVNFIGTMLSRLSISGSSERASTIEWRVADLLIDALVNIKRELKLFEDTAQSEGWLEDICNAVPTPHTRAYQDLFAGAAHSSRPLVVSLVALWATEECYLRSWRHAWSKADHALSAEEKDVMQRVFIPNWSSSEFDAFVSRIEGLVNNFGTTIEEGGREWGQCEEVWRQVLWAEKNFWPDV